LFRNLPVAGLCLFDQRFSSVADITQSVSRCASDRIGHFLPLVCTLVHRILRMIFRVGHREIPRFHGVYSGFELD
jgi:hypothetical protein